MNTFISLCALASFLLLLLLCVKSGESIQCWECSSDLDSRCGDPFNMTHFALTDCERDRIQSSYGWSVSVCKKAKQRTHNGLVTIRSCYLMHDKERPRDGSCYDPSFNYDNKYEYCSICSHNECNAASGLSITAATLLPLGAILVRYVGKYM